MKCFYHPNAEAVGICKSCAKGICIDCAADMGKGLACKQRCEVDVVRYTALLDSAFEDREIGRKTLRSNRRSRLSWSVFFLVLGGIILLSAYGLYIKGKGKEFQLAFFPDCSHASMG